MFKCINYDEELKINNNTLSLVLYVLEIIKNKNKFTILDLKKYQSENFINKDDNFYNRITQKILRSLIKHNIIIKNKQGLNYNENFYESELYDKIIKKRDFYIRILLLIDNIKKYNTTNLKILSKKTKIKKTTVKGMLQTLKRRGVLIQDYTKPQIIYNSTGTTILNKIEYTYILEPTFKWD